ncbi:MAG: DUF433 domain-containing protein [Armatimonadota bacterium]|nr:DUF433 domain-containing protein [Armatimonadota bacterium]
MKVEPLATYKYLELRPETGRKQAYIKGRNMTVWQLLATMWANNQTPEQAAKNRSLPVEAIYEALDYYEKNKDLIHAEVDEETQWLKERGLI